MTVAAGLLALACACALDVPAPAVARGGKDDPRVRERATLDREASRLADLAKSLETAGDKGGAAEVRRALPPAPPKDGATRFVPLAAVVPGPARPGGLANVAASGASTTKPKWRAEFDSIRAESGKALFDLANQAVENEPRHYALAQDCLRRVIERVPDHPEARRLLGYVPHEGGWATPFAVSQLRSGKVLHPTYGWVPAGWVPHLEKGELPAPDTRRWLAADEADALRRNWAAPWKIDTEHFEIRTNVPLSEAIAFGRHLEAFHDLFFAMLADVLGDRTPLAQRFKQKAKTGETDGPSHKVYYFASRDEFIEHLRPLQGDAAEQILGVYVPPRKGVRPAVAPAYFFRDPGGQLDVTATLYHEVSHQLLFESGGAGMNDFKKNVGNYWVFEGLGTYFETLQPQPDGSIEIGGLVGERLLAAKQNLVEKGRIVPLADYARLDQDGFNERGDVYLNYQEAIAFATFFLQGGGGKYREGFLDYVRDAYFGRLRRTGGRSLEDRLDSTYDRLQKEMLDYLGGNAAAH